MEKLWTTKPSVKEQIVMNPMDLIKNFQNIQSRVGEMQEKLKDVIVSGTSGGDAVTDGGLPCSNGRFSVKPV